MQVLAHWSQQGHKALVFTQTQQMLDIFERAVQVKEYRSGFGSRTFAFFLCSCAAEPMPMAGCRPYLGYLYQCGPSPATNE